MLTYNNLQHRDFSLDVAASPVRGKEPSIATANNIDTLLGATESTEIVQPPEAVQDKVHFIFNNISQTNLQQKVSYLTQPDPLCVLGFCTLVSLALRKS